MELDGGVDEDLDIGGAGVQTDWSIQDLMLMFERHMNTKVVDMLIAYMIFLSSTILSLSGIVRIEGKKTNKPLGETTQSDEDEDPYLRNPLL